MDLAVACHLDRNAVTRMLAAGTAWGVTLGVGLTALNAMQCGLPCPGDVAFTTAMSVAAGVLTIGPIAAFHSRR